MTKSATATLGTRMSMEFRIQKKESAREPEKTLFQSWLHDDRDKPLHCEEFKSPPVTRRFQDYI